jgi:predicted dehydrogenase
MIRVGIVGLGKMGLSHYSLFNVHPKVEIVGICDKASYVTDILSKYSAVRCDGDFEHFVETQPMDAIVIATPPAMHASMVEQALHKGIHVFCEKPFVLNVSTGERLVEVAESKGLQNQVGYHYRFVAAFIEARRIVQSGALGRIHHVRAEAYGPVVLKAKGGSWRSARNEGGGALFDYACHALDSLNFIVGAPSSVSGVTLASIFSQDVEDEVYCTLRYEDGTSGQLCVNWSDESYRKMSTKISVWGTNGRLTVDRQEVQLYLRSAHKGLPGSAAGWAIKYTTEMKNDVWFYMRGEEYSAQVDYFLNAIENGTRNNVNSFRSALETDRLIASIVSDSTEKADPSSAPLVRRSLWARHFR